VEIGPRSNHLDVDLIQFRIYIRGPESGSILFFMEFFGKLVGEVQGTVVRSVLLAMRQHWFFCGSLRSLITFAIVIV